VNDEQCMAIIAAILTANGGMDRYANLEEVFDVAYSLMGHARIAKGRILETARLKMAFADVDCGTL